MAKGQMRSNKEKKKPKADKNLKKGGAAPSPFASGKTAGRPKPEQQEVTVAEGAVWFAAAEAACRRESAASGMHLASGIHRDMQPWVALSRLIQRRQIPFTMGGQESASRA